MELLGTITYTTAPDVCIQRSWSNRAEVWICDLQPQLSIYLAEIVSYLLEMTMTQSLGRW